jgi:hypothetical protein
MHFPSAAHLWSSTLRHGVLNKNAIASHFKLDSCGSKIETSKDHSDQQPDRHFLGDELQDSRQGGNILPGTPQRVPILPRIP